jgi:hypothetical protein
LARPYYVAEEQRRKDHIRFLLKTMVDRPMTAVVPVKKNIERTAFPSFGRVDAAFCPASLSRKAFNVYGLPPVSSTGRSSQIVIYSG